MTGDTFAAVMAHHFPLNDPSSTATRSHRNYLPVVEFDAGTEEYAVCSLTLPSTFPAATGIVVVAHLMGKTATSGNVVVEGAFERHLAGTDDVDSDSFASGVSATVAAAGTSGSEFYATLTFTSSQIDGLVPGERFRFKFTRKAADGSDTMTGDLQLVGLHFKEGS